MNRSQAIALGIAALNLALMLLFPPYDYVSLQQAVETATHDNGALYVVILDKEGVVAGDSQHPERQGQRAADPTSRRSLVVNEVVIRTWSARPCRASVTRLWTSPCPCRWRARRCAGARCASDCRCNRCTRR